jgi:hypothetical protein
MRDSLLEPLVQFWDDLVARQPSYRVEVLLDGPIKIRDSHSGTSQCFGI